MDWSVLDWNAPSIAFYKQVLGAKVSPKSKKNSLRMIDMLTRGVTLVRSPWTAGRGCVWKAKKRLKGSSRLVSK